ncbi:hypothetical protein HYX07_03290 [Candidatus Woesearchaeota archaeon]|nr:hypothetical protein [Candidatus Woesearchaeota archaeon]
MVIIINAKKNSRIYVIFAVSAIFLLFLAISVEAGRRRGGGGGSPPPPPPCPIQSAGCYKAGDIKASFGELATSDFRYYLSENKCKRSGGCDCRGVPDNIPQETNPDDSSGACNCISGTDWNAKAKCCGDDAEDCGRISSGVLCSIDANAESSQWLPSTPNLGDIRYVGCSRLEYLSDGNNWLKCEGTFWKKTVGNSEYMCIGRGRESIVECCGDGSCKSRVDGKRLSTGQSVNPEKFENEAASTFKFGATTTQDCKIVKKTGCTDFKDCEGMSFFDFQCAIRQVCSETGQPISGFVTLQGKTPAPKGSICTPTQVYDCEKEVCTTITGNVVADQITANAVSTSDTKTYYCRSDRKFVTDLDVPTSLAKDRTLIGRNAATCEKAGLTWTGTKCCSEDDDKEEYYNDPAGKGGCFDKKPVISVAFVEGTDDSVVNFNGEFHGCVIEKQNFNTKNDDFLGLSDRHTGAQLITNHDYCFNDPGKNYFCSYTEKWLPTDGTDKSHVSFAPVQNAKQPADCCAADECWDGEKCIENMKLDPLAKPIGNDSRCIDGEWTNSQLKTTVDEGASGFCPKSSQCLLNVFGKDEQNQCVDSGSYVSDNYCENGIWTSRTKLLALRLLKLKSNDYTLFCDTRDNALNNLQYLTDSNEIVANTLSNLQTNNFCILKTGNKIVAATSINKALEDVPANSLNIFGVTSCDSALVDDGQYHSCDATNKAWFNKELKSFIYSANAISIPSESNQSSSFEEFLGSPIKNIINSIKRLISNPPFDESYLKGIKKFDKLYMSQQGSKTIRGSLEGAKFKNTVIEYTSFDTDICSLVEQFSIAKKDASSGISCKKEGSNYYVLVQGSQFTTINPESIWTDLTSKLRIK